MLERCRSHRQEMTGRLRLLCGKEGGALGDPLVEDVMLGQNCRDVVGTSFPLRRLTMGSVK